jgi:hypothetical protein
LCVCVREEVWNAAGRRRAGTSGFQSAGRIQDDKIPQAIFRTAPRNVWMDMCTLHRMPGSRPRKDDETGASAVSSQRVSFSCARKLFAQDERMQHEEKHKERAGKRERERETLSQQTLFKLEYLLQ